MKNRISKIILLCINKITVTRGIILRAKIFIIRDKNKYDIIFSSETVERVHDGFSGLALYYDNGFSETFFTPYPCNALCRLKVTTRYKYGSYNILVYRVFLFKRAGECVNFSLGSSVNVFFGWLKCIVLYSTPKVLRQNRLHTSPYHFF